MDVVGVLLVVVDVFVVVDTIGVVVVVVCTGVVEVVEKHAGKPLRNVF